MPRFVSIIWNPDPRGNIEKIADHGLTTQEVDEVLLDPAARPGFSRNSGKPTLRGWTSTGRYVLVIYDRIDRLTVEPVTAYDIEP